MEILDFLGYLSALLIGVSLGLIGGGGSILAVPVLTYLFMLEERMATAYSLFVVGSTALIGGLQQHKKGLVDWKTALVFGIPSIIGVSLVRAYAIPALPEHLFDIRDFQVTRRMLMLGLFGLLMIPAGISMIMKRKQVPSITPAATHFNYPLILLEGSIVGGISGLVGAGGGFLIIPALVLLGKLSMKTAVGTSLVIISMQSLLGFFVGDVLTATIDWIFLLPLTGIAIAGIFLGTFLGNFLGGDKLKMAFGYFIFGMAGFIFYMEFLVKA